MQSRMNARKKGARFGILAAVILAELIGVVVFLLAPQLIAAFDSSPEIIRFGVEKPEQQRYLLSACIFTFHCSNFARCGEDDGVHDHYDDVLVRDPGVFPFRDDSAHSQHSGGILGISADMEFKFSGIFSGIIRKRSGYNK